MEVARAVTIVQEKNDDRYVLDIKTRRYIFFKYLFVETNILFNVMDIMSQLKEKWIPIIVPFCMKKTILYIYVCVCVC